MSTSGRTVWWAKDAGWWRREENVILSERHGIAGPAVHDYLITEAMLADGGVLRHVGPVSIARYTGAAEVVVAAVLHDMAALGLLRHVDGGGLMVLGAQVEQRRQRGAARRLSRKAPGIEDRIAYYGGLCWMCLSAPWEDIDHVKPLAAGGTNHLSNLRPACAACNRSKSGRWPYPTRKGVRACRG